MDPIWKLVFNLAVSVGVSALALYLAQRAYPLFPSLSSPASPRQQTLRKRAATILFLFLFFIYVLVFLALSLMRFYALQLRTSLDTALFDQTVWNASAGYLFKSTILDSGEPIGYFMPLILALVPLYGILADARTLLIFQTIALAASALPIYWYARQQVGSYLALALVCSLFLSPYIQHVNLTGFHVIAIAAPLSAFVVYFLLRREYAPFIACAMLLWLVKEETTLLVIGAGLYLFLVQRQRRLGILFLAFGSIAFYVILMFVVPAITGNPYFVGRPFFASFGNSVPEILTTLVTHPDLLWSTLVQPGKIEYILDLLIPLGLLPLVGLEVNLVALPVIIGFLATNPSHAMIGGQYSASIFPTLYFASIVGLRRLLHVFGIKSVHYQNYFSKPAIISALSVFVLVSMILSARMLSPGPLGGEFDPSFYNVTAQTMSLQDVMNEIPPGAVVAAQEELVANFSNRKSIYIFPDVSYYSVDYVILEKGRFFYDLHKQEVDRWLASGYFQVLSDANDFVLAKRKDPTIPLGVRWGEDLTLVSYSLVPEQNIFTGTETLRPIVQWRAEKDIQNRYVIQVHLIDPQGHLLAMDDRDPQKGSLPTNLWTKDQIINDQYELPLSPAMPGGNYRIVMQILDSQTGRSLDAYDPSGHLLGKQMTLATIQVEKNKASFLASELDIENRASVDMREIRFIGCTSIPRAVSAGSVLSLGIYWRARQIPRGDYVVDVQLRDAGGQVVLEQSSRPSAGAEPTTQWNNGEVVLDWHDLTLPIDMTVGTYDLMIDLRDQDQSILGQAKIATVTIAH